MRALLQRVTDASVSVDGNIIGAVNKGLVILLGINERDDETIARSMVNKIINLRIFEDKEGKINLSAMDVNAELLAISQFTLYADCRRGRRPSFTDAARPEISEPLYEKFVELLQETGLKTQQGQFGANMLVHINNDGPVTIMLDSDEKR